MKIKRAKQLKHLQDVSMPFGGEPTKEDLKLITQYIQRVKRGNDVSVRRKRRGIAV